MTDPRPGRILYVMTEDLEAIDSAGYAVAWGNSDGWLNPQELQVQMVEKADCLNAIADKHGAKWTHYTTWPLLKAAEWAERQSGTGRWGRRGSIHADGGLKMVPPGAMNMAFTCIPITIPRIPGNLLSYNPATDGIWANHLRHGWAHSLNRKVSPVNWTAVPVCSTITKVLWMNCQRIHRRDSY